MGADGMNRGFLVWVGGWLGAVPGGGGGGGGRGCL